MYFHSQAVWYLINNRATFSKQLYSKQKKIKKGYDKKKNLPLKKSTQNKTKHNHIKRKQIPNIIHFKFR